MRRGPYVAFKRLLLIPSSSRVRIRTTRARARPPIFPASTSPSVKTVKTVKTEETEETEETPIEEVDARLLAAITQTMRMHYVRESKIKGERVRNEEDVWERERKAREVRRERREVERVKERERDREREMEVERERERERVKERVWLFADDSDFTPIPVDLED